MAIAAGLAACSKGGAGDGPHRGEPIRVAAAADLAVAFKELGTAFESKTGKKIAFSFGSTGLLAKQIAEGAPFEVFAAANVAFVDDVVKSGQCRKDTQALYARGRIVLWAKDEASLPKSLEDLRDPRFKKIAIANPEHAPYGRAAQQALIKAGVWETVKTRAVYGENIQQTFAYGQSGNAEVAIIALSLATVSEGKYREIDMATHEPLDQAMVICNGGSRGTKSNEAKQFVDFVSSPEGRGIMKKYGFLLPGESAPPK